MTHSHAANLQGKAAVNDYDLSLYDVNGKEIIGGSSTANCYVIHGPGTYRIPCVYGNTLKLGQYNGYAVDGQNESGEGEAFVNYSGTRIDESNYKFTPASADVVWQSTSGVITNAAVTTGSDGMSYITFTVNKTNLQQGNAVIAARDASGHRDVELASLDHRRHADGTQQRLPHAEPRMGEQQRQLQPLPCAHRAAPYHADQ